MPHGYESKLIRDTKDEGTRRNLGLVYHTSVHALHDRKSESVHGEV